MEEHKSSNHSYTNTTFLPIAKKEKSLTTYQKFQGPNLLEQTPMVQLHKKNGKELKEVRNPIVKTREASHK